MEDIRMYIKADMLEFSNSIKDDLPDKVIFKEMVFVSSVR